MKTRFNSFNEFYPFYLQQHSTRLCRLMHLMGSWCALSLLVAALVSRLWWLCGLMPLAGYGFAWFGHYVFEKNRPATFTNPFFSFMGDWVMFFQIHTGKRHL